jgi:hypothetical protein
MPPYIKKFARNPFFLRFWRGFPVDAHRRHECKSTMVTIMEISHPECLTSNRVNSDPPIAWPCAIPVFASFAHQTVNAAKVTRKSVEGIFSPLLGTLARLVGLERGNRSSCRNPQIHVYKTRSIPSTVTNACSLSHSRMRNNGDVIDPVICGMIWELRAKFDISEQQCRSQITGTLLPSIFELFLSFPQSRFRQNAIAFL